MKLVFTEADWLKGEQLDYSLFKEQQYQVYGRGIVSLARY